MEEQRIGSLANSRNVQILESLHPKYKARVSVQTGHIEVSIDCSRFEASCPCKYCTETGLNCSHIKALLLQLDGLRLASSWIDKRFHVETYANSYYNAYVTGMCVAGKLEANEQYCAPDYKQYAGRPSKKRKDRSHLRTTDIRRECKACGKLGHFAASCTEPSTEFRFAKHKDKAIKWCKSREGIEIEEE